jgi:hypothetical protein
VLAGQGLLIGLAVAGFDCLPHDLRSNAPLAKSLADAPLAQLLVLLAQAGVSLGKGRFVQVAVFLDAGDNLSDGSRATLARLGLRWKKPARTGEELTLRRAPEGSESARSAEPVNRVRSSPREHPYPKRLNFFFSGTAVVWPQMD